MAKKARTKPASDDKTSTGSGAKNIAVKKKGGAKKKATSTKAAMKNERKALRATLEKEVIMAVEQFCKETTHLGTYAREFFDSLHKSGVTLPKKSRKALAISAGDLRKAARTLKKIAGSRGR